VAEELTVLGIVRSKIGRPKIAAEGTVPSRIVPRKTEAFRGLPIQSAECSGMTPTPTTAEDKGTTELQKCGTVAMLVRVRVLRGRRMLVRTRTRLAGSETRVRVMDMTTGHITNG
jgi:hypothetical protein